MESVDTTACLIDNLLDFASDVGEEDIDDEHGKPLPSTTSSLPFDVLEKDDTARLLPEVAEEELEWISNKDAFPTVETFVDILSDQHQDALRKHSSPVSVLDNSTASSSGGRVSRFIIASYRGSFQVPVKARSRSHSRRRRDVQEDRWWWCRRQEHVKSAKAAAGMTASTMGKKCQHCGAEKTPQWRAGPLGPKTLCNACGVRYKSGRLVPEYRPASSPSFCGELHSNSHRKVLEMRKRKQMMGLLIEKPMDKG